MFNLLLPLIAPLIGLFYNLRNSNEENCDEKGSVFLVKQLAKMKSIGNKKLLIQTLSVELVRLLFIFFMILMVSIASNIGCQNPDPMLDEKPVIAKVMNPQPMEDDGTAAQMVEHSLTPVHSNQTERLFHPIIIQTATRYQIDPALVKAIIMAESGYNPKGVRYFKQLMNQFSGDLKLALAAYNAGSKTVRQYKGVPPFKETQNYIKKVFEYFQLYKNQIKEEVDNA